MQCTIIRQLTTLNSEDTTGITSKAQQRRDNHQSTWSHIVEEIWREGTGGRGRRGGAPSDVDLVTSHMATHLAQVERELLTEEKYWKRLMTRHQNQIQLTWITLLIILKLALYSLQDNRIKQLEEHTAI